MNSKSPKGRSIIFASWLILAILIANSSFLSYKYWQFYFAGGMLEAFNCTDGCDSVMMSKYALLFGLPTPFYGLVAFLLIGALYSLLLVLKEKHKLIILALDSILVSACFAALTFLYIMYQVLHMVCKFCLLSHICTLTFALIYFFYIRKQLIKS